MCENVNFLRKNKIVAVACDWPLDVCLWLWPNTVFMHTPANAIQCPHKDYKNKHAFDATILMILFAQCPLCLR